MKLSLLIFSCLTSSLLAVEAPAKSQNYFKRLLERPQTGVIFDRFCDAFLAERSPAELSEFLNGEPTHLVLALWQRRQHQMDEARTTLLGVVAREPANAAALELLADTQLSLRDAAAAVKSVDQLIALKDIDETTRERVSQLRARCLWKAGRNAEAIKQWESLLAAKPGDTDLQEGFLDALDREGSWEELAKQLRAMLPRTSDAFLAVERQLRLSRALLAMNAKDEALVALEETLAKSAVNSWIETEALAQIESTFRRGDDVKALATEMQKLRTANPTRVLLAMRTARLLGEIGSINEARAIHRDMLERVPGDRALREEIAVQLGAWALWSDAAEQWRHLSATFPQDSTLRLKLAESLLRGEKIADAMAEARTFVQLQQGSEAAWLRAAAVFREATHRVEAITLLEEASKAWPASLSIVRGHAEALTDAKRHADAKPLWTRLANEGAVDDLITAITRLRMAEDPNEALWSLMLKRETDFASDRRYLRALCDLALSTHHEKDAVPRALAVVRLSATTEDALSSMDWAVRFFKAIEIIPDWRGIVSEVGGETRATVMHALAEEANERSDMATELMQPLIDRASQESGTKLSADSSLAMRGWLELLQQRQDFARAAEATELLLTHEGERTSHLMQNAVQLWEHAYQTERALDAAERWRIAAPMDASAWVTHARLLSLHGSKDKAVTMLQEAARKLDGSSDALAMIAQAQEKFGDPDEALTLALALYDRAQRDEERVQLATSAARAALQINDLAYASVLDRLRQAHERERSRAMPALALAAAMEADKRTDAAQVQAMIETAVRAEPRHVLALTRLALWHQAAKNWSAAVKTWRQIAEIKPDPSTKQALGRALVKDGQLAEGLRLTVEAAKSLGVVVDLSDEPNDDNLSVSNAASLAEQLVLIAKGLHVNIESQGLASKLKKAREVLLSPRIQPEGVLAAVQTMLESGSITQGEAGTALVIAGALKHGGELLASAVRAAPENIGVRRVLMLTLACGDVDAAARIYIETPSKDRASMIPDVFRRLPFVEHLNVEFECNAMALAHAVVRAAGERNEDVPGPAWIADALKNELWYRHTQHRNLAFDRSAFFCAPYRRDITAAQRAGLSAPLKEHDDFCIAALRVPSLARDAFALLAASRPDDEALEAHAKTALEVSARVTPRRSLLSFSVDPALCRWTPTPEKFLVFKAWKRGRLNSELDSILKLAPPSLADETRAFATMLSCPAAEFSAKVVEGKRGPEVSEHPLASVLVAWELRGCAADIAPFIDRVLARIKGSQDYVWEARGLGRYAALLAEHGRQAEAEAFMLRTCEALLGPRASWAENWPNTLSEAANDFLVAAACASPALLMPMVNLRADFDRGDPDVDNSAFVLSDVLPAFCRSDGGVLAALAKREDIEALMKGLCFINGRPMAWKLHRTAATFIEAMAAEMPSDATFRLQLRLWAEDHASSAGVEVFSALVREEMAELVEVIVRRQAEFGAMPANLLSEWIGVFERALKDRPGSMEAMLSRASKIAEHIKAHEVEKRQDAIDKLVRAKSFSELGFKKQHHEFHDELMKIAHQLMNENVMLAQAALNNGLHLVDAEWVKGRWNAGYTSNGWTAASGMLWDWMRTAKDLPSLMVACNILGAKSERALVHGMWPNTPPTWKLFHEAWLSHGGGVDGARALFGEMDKTLSPGPAPMLWFSFSNWAENEEPWLRHDLETKVVAALKTEPGRVGECSTMLDVALRFRKLTKGDVVASDVVAVKQWFDQTANDERVNPMVSFGLTHYLMNRLATLMDRETILRAGRQCIATMKLNQPGQGFCYQSAANAMLTLPGDDEWKSLAREMVSVWTERSKHERAGTNRAFEPEAQVDFAFFELGCRCSSDKELPPLLKLARDRNIAPVLIAMLRGGHIEFARNYFQHNAEVMKRENLNNVAFTSADEPALESMLSGMKDADERFHAEALIKSIAGNGNSVGLYGWAQRDWDQRLTELAQRWLTHDWKDAKAKKAAFKAIVWSPHAGDLIFPTLGKAEVEQIVAESKPFDDVWKSGRAFEIDAWERFTREPEARVVQPHLNTLYESWLIAARVQERIAFKAPSMSRDELSKACAVSRKVLERVSRQSRNSEWLSSMLSQHLCLVAAANDGAAEREWRSHLGSAATHEAVRGFLAEKKELWSGLQPFVHAADGSLRPVNERVAILCRLFSDAWTLAAWKEVRNLPQLLLEHHVLNASELRDNAAALSEAVPFDGCTAAAFAVLAVESGDTKGCEALLKQGIRQATAARRESLVTNFAGRLKELH